MESVLYDAAGHRRSPVTMPGSHQGRPPRNRGMSHPGPSQQCELMHHLPGWLAAVRYALTPVWGTLPQSPTTFRLVFQSPTTRIYQLDASAPTSARRAVR